MKRYVLLLLLCVANIFSATYYVRSTDGDDGDDGLTVGNAWATVQYAFDNTTAGDIVLVCADGTHTPTATIDIDNTNIVTGANPLTVRGCAADGTDDGTVATITGASISSNYIFNYNVSGIAVRCSNLRLTASTSTAAYIQSTVDAAVISFDNCQFDNASGAGVTINESSQTCVVMFTFCEFNNNGTYGSGNATSARGGGYYKYCSFHDNTSHGIYERGRYGKVVVDDCLIYDNGGDGILYDEASYDIKISNSVVFGNTGDGIELASGSYAKIINTIIRSNGGYGVNKNSGNIGELYYFDYNCSHNNTSGHIDINSGNLPGSNNVTSDPKFTSETNGSEDFTLQSDSPCKNTGLNPKGL